MRKFTRKIKTTKKRGGDSSGNYHTFKASDFGIESPPKSSSNNKSSSYYDKFNPEDFDLPSKQGKSRRRSRRRRKMKKNLKRSKKIIKQRNL